MQALIALRILRPACRGQRAQLGAAAALGVVSVLLDLARPWPLAFAIDHALRARRGGFSLLVLAAGALAMITAVSAVVDMAGTTSAERAAERVGADMRQTLFVQIVALSPRWHDRMRSGELVSRLTTDVGRLLDALVAVTITLVPDLLRLALVTVALTAFAPGLALVALMVVPVLAVFTVGQRRRVRAVQQQARHDSGRMTSTAIDLLRNVRAVQAFNRATTAAGTFTRCSDAVRQANERAILVEARWTPVADAILVLGSALVLVTGGRAVLSGRLSVGELLVVMTYLASLYSPVRSLSRLSGVLAKASASRDRITDVLHSTERVTEPRKPRRLALPADTIRFNSVSFAYTTHAPVLQDLDLAVGAGETVALVGPSGCGKSTTLSLLLRMYDVDAGSIEIGGVDVRDLELAELRRHVAYVPQDAWLLDTTIAGNIAFGAPHAARHEVLAAGRTALVDEFALPLPDGYDSSVGEQGSLLSGGQRRRVALARAIASDAPVVLLDEPTASLDQVSARTLVTAIRRATAGRTVLIVTHDPALAAAADRVVALDRAAPVPVVGLDSMPTPVRRAEEVIA